MTVVSTIDEDVSLAQVQSLYEAGLYLQAHEAGRALRPLRQWRGKTGRLLASRLALRLGAQKLSRQLLLLAYREFPMDWEVRYYYAYHLLHRRGPLRAAEALIDCKDVERATDVQQADWLALSGSVHALLRDFDAAQLFIQRAMAIKPEHPWVWVEQGFVLTAMDRRDEALAAYDHALSLRPWYRPAVEGKADILTDRGDDQATLAFLQSAVERLEYGHLVARQAAILREMQQYEASRELYERCRTYYPLADKIYLDWLNASCADAAYYCGDFATASSLAAKVDTEFMKAWGERLTNAKPDDRRVLLPVPFVRQHHLTCAPATLSAISQYWGEPADHLEVAEKICYDGTPGHSERNWAGQRWARVREFAVDWNTALALIDRGIPFTLETRTAISAHLQAVVGYDSRRGTLLIRNPGQRYTEEFIQESLFKNLASVGPRGMVFVPSSAAATLDEVALPEAADFDRYYTLQCALADHDRERAQQVAAQLDAESPDARLTLVARRTLCYYDGDLAGAIAITDQLLERYPNDSKLQHERLEFLGSLGRIAERTERLASLCAESGAPAVVWREYGQELANDARRHGEALWWLKKAAAALGPDAITYVTLANIHWEQGRREQSLRLYRYAACIEDKWESYAKRYFIAARHLKCEGEVLKFLSRRFDEYGLKASGPAITLYWALKELDRNEEADQLLDAALQKRPTDGALLTFAAEEKAWANRHDEAESLLTRASQCAYRGAWLRAAAYVAEARGDVQESLRAWQSLAQLEPLNADAHGRIYDLLRAIEGESFALDYIRRIGAAHVHHVRIQQLLLLKLRGADLAEATEVARRMLTLHPGDGWTRRELYQLLAQQGAVEEALREAHAAVAAEPYEEASFTCRAQLLSSLGMRERAREDFRQALRISIDCQSAVDGLLEICDSSAERSEAVQFIAAECRRQTTFGEAPLMLVERAQGILTADEVLQLAREAHAVRPDLWQTWCALGIQLRHCKRLDEALQIALDATERFPLMLRNWLELARIHRDAERVDEQIAAYQRAREVNPAWGLAAQELSDVFAATGETEKAFAVLEEVARRAPTDLVSQAYLADLKWKHDRHDEAIQLLNRVCRLSPGYEWAWNTLRNWLLEREQGAELLATAQSLVALRPGNAEGWVRRAETIGATGGDVNEQLAAYGRAAEIQPAHLDAQCGRVELLAKERRFDEALDVCRSPIWGNDPPVRLRAWEADVHGQKGELAEAINGLTQILEEFPRYSWACYRLNDYLWQAERWEEGRRAADKFTELEPNDAMSWGYLGDFAFRVRDRTKAKEAFAKSCEVDKKYEFGARRLAELLFEDGEAERAQAVMEELSKHAQENPYTLALKVRISIKLHGRKADLSAIESLAALESNDLDGYREFGAAVKQHGDFRRAQRLLWRAVCDEGANPLLGAACIAATGVDWPTLAKLCLARPRTSAWRVAASQFAEHCAAHDVKWKAAALTVLLRGPLRADLQSWAIVGYALVCVDQYWIAIRWLRDWRERASVQPWMICNMSFAEWMMGRFMAAVESSETALALVQDHSHDRHVVLKAGAKFVLGGDAGEIVRMLTDVDDRNLDASYIAIRDVTLVAAKEVASPTGDYIEAFHKLNAAVGKYRGWLNKSAGGKMLAHAVMEQLARAYRHRLRASWCGLCRAMRLPY